MLIRSQDKKEIIVLESVVGLSIEFFGGEPHIVANPKNGGMKKLGIYSSEEKAIKVLDMIQNEYGTHYYGNGGPMATANFYIPPFKYIPPKVFQMPQDSEV